MTASLVHLGLIVGGVVAAVGGMGWLARLAFGSAELPGRGRRPVEPAPPPHRPIEVVAADLRRLARQLERVPAGVPMARRRGLQAAYDDVLVEAALLLAVPHTLADRPDGRARDVERLRLRAAVSDAGLVCD
ncbi:hypothetical protein [Modestobacter sp. I12A-02662]|uniref:hypothetical protein n=1 Tax=Modestobacter sp. I12A-02662 TaxID=1730496 RepID=UPI0034DE6C20